MTELFKILSVVFVASVLLFISFGLVGIYITETFPTEWSEEGRFIHALFSVGIPVVVAITDKYFS